MMIASLAKSVPPLVDRHQTAFLENLHTNLGQIKYLGNAFQTELKGTIEDALGEEDPEKKSLQIWNIADRFWFALVEGEVQRFKSLDVGIGKNLDVRWFRADRLSEEIVHTGLPGLRTPHRESPYGRPLDTNLLLQELLPNYPLADRVVELENQGSLGSFDYLGFTHRALAQYNLNLYGESDGRRLARLPALSLMQSALIFCLGDQALRFCFTSGLEITQEIELQLLGYASVPLGESDVLMKSPNHPDPVLATINSFMPISSISAYLPLNMQKARYLLAQCCQELFDGGVIDSFLPKSSDLHSKLARRRLIDQLKTLIVMRIDTNCCDEVEDPLIDLNRLVDEVASPEITVPILEISIPNKEMAGYRKVLHRLLSSYLSRLEEHFSNEWHKELREHIRELRDCLKREFRD